MYTSVTTPQFHVTGKWRGVWAPSSTCLLCCFYQICIIFITDNNYYPIIMHYSILNCPNPTLELIFQWGQQVPAGWSPSTSSKIDEITFLFSSCNLLSWPVRAQEMPQDVGRLKFSTEAWLTVSFLPKWKQSLLFSVLPLPLLLCTRSLPPSFPSQTHKDLFDILVSISPQSRHPHLKPRTAQGEFKSCLFLSLIWSVCPFLEVEFLMRTSNSICVCIYMYIFFFMTDVSSIYHLLRPGDHWLR